MVMSSPLHRRRGLTLVESLVAMFVAALAMISLLALFPLGALQMAQALKDARCTETATNADALMRTYWATEVLERQNDTNLPSPQLLGSGKPVFVDPIGFVTQPDNLVGLPPNQSKSVAGMTVVVTVNVSGVPTPTTFAQIPRTTLNNMGTQAARLRFCSLLDDMTFDLGGQPVRSGNVVERAARYNWMAVLQRPLAGSGTSSNMSILVFDGRSPSFTPLGSEVDYPGWDDVTPSPATPPGTFAGGGPSPRYSVIVPGSSTISLKFVPGTVNPAIAKGRWLGVFTPGRQLLTFHRVTSVTESQQSNTLGNVAVYTCDLQTPISPNHATTATALTFTGLAEVFERPQLTGQ